MLREILSSEICAKCRYCCFFDDDELWELPIKEGLVKENGLTRCPALKKDGCSLGDAKPAECRLWPFRVMSIDDKLALALSPSCKHMFSMPLNKIYEFVKNGFAEKAHALANENPGSIIKYREEYIILSFLT